MLYKEITTIFPEDRKKGAHITQARCRVL